MTIGDLPARNARKFPDKLALVSEGLSLTFSELNRRVNRLANFLLDAGIEKGDRIGVLIHNCHQFIELYFAAAKIGAVFCPYNNHFKQEELGEVINYSLPRFLFVDQDFVDIVSTLKLALRSVERYVCLQQPTPVFMDDYEAIVGRGCSEEPDASVREDDVLSIIFTGGTTGKPKGAMRTHRHLMSNAVASVIELKVDYDDKILIAFPIYHVAGEDNIVRHTFMPNTIHTRREGRFKPEEVLEYISRERITRCQFVPTMIHSLLQVTDIGRYDLRSLRLILYTGSSMPVELLRNALAVFPCRFAGLYGLTEGGPVTTLLKPEDHLLDGSEKSLARLASCGKAVINHEIKIVDENDREVSAGEVGEIACKSEAVMIGYWQMPEETARKLKNGWLHTGDLGKLDEDGYMYVVERKDDMIVSGGVNIYPREIEEILYRHPAVSEAAVVGLRDEHWGEGATAIIVLKEGASATEADIIEFCGKNLAGFKKPKAVYFWNELPKSPQGKILKKEIRKHYGS
ncbi:MAG TPA: long-chain-fatty-acid--CoA ligase [Syntrophorhabdales bacterium]|nr:long-chain-fatty-acid--CoA ligase [Syntrophorhabdales bacterium]